MTLFLQQIVDGLSSGALYAATALSLVLVYRASGFLNFAQAEMATFGTFVVWQLWIWGVPLWAAVSLSLVLSFFGGALMERTLIRPLTRSASHLTLIIVTLGVMLILLNGAGWIFDFGVKEFPSVLGGPVVELGPAVISRQSLVVICTVFLLAAALWVLFQHTRIGLVMRAAVDNPESADLMGLPTGTVLTISWGLAAAIGTLMGVLVAPQVFLAPGMLLPTLIYSFTAAILGGLDSPQGAIVGGFIVGISENLAGSYLPGIGADFKQAVALAIIMAVLLFKSEGLFGTKGVIRV
ncbi:branched-chain amino acid ABC transporter permease [Nocardioides sp. LHD-245]|uniref:branched-chain amino acid ABC transporter permease n=1 Tax=Nocardioides sp. LHD-245 TaxID=3051387 RepID=UPI0027E0CBFA|nr:branched-chain amino acid ABC transporter permease [Nocardioides sp. LHD-245]